MSTPALFVMGSPGEAVPLPDEASPIAQAATHGPDGLELDPRGRAPGAKYAVDDHAGWASSQHDGAIFAEDQLDLTEHPTVHAVYVHPSDKVSRFTQFAGMFEADARQASGLLESLYGRAFRFDERPRRDDPARKVLDITVLQSNYTASQLSGSNQFSLVATALSAAGLNKENKKYAVWLDAGSQYCGQGELYQDTRRSSSNNNELRTLGVVYRPYDMSDPSTGGFCRGRTLRHELGHNLGALQKVAPNAFDGAHCRDSTEDTMCYTPPARRDTGGPDFDYKNNDYWDPFAAPRARSTAKLGWWAVNLSKYICPRVGTAPDCTAPNSNPGY